jgi:hypothetical protein
MRNSQTLSLTYSGTRPQTILFHRDAKIQERNLGAADALIASLGTAWKENGLKYDRDGDPDSWPSPSISTESRPKSARGSSWSRRRSRS